MFETQTVKMEEYKEETEEGQEEGAKVKVTYQDKEGSVQSKVVDVVMISTGRVPNVENLDCQAAGVQYDQFGITVNQYLQTANPNIYAVGDCLPGYKFTHNSDIHARYVVRNALFQDTKDKDKIILPYCTYTDPEVASVGMNEIMLKS